MATAQPGIKVAIFSGGAGSRLWPVSRRARPKQFQPLVGPESLFRQMILLLGETFGMENLFVFTGKDYIESVHEHAPELPPENVVAEPEMRDTLAAVGYAAAVIEHRFPGTRLATLWGGDHIIRNTGAFQQALRAACTLLDETSVNAMVDVRPTFPSTQLGYVQIGAEVGHVDGLSAYSFERFVEKPVILEAEEYVAGGHHLWNTGYFIWQSGALLDLYRRHAPETHEALERMMRAMGTEREASVTASAYASIPKMSVDYGVFSHIEPGEMIAIAADLGWADVGAWDVLRDELSDVEGQNVVLAARHLALDTHNSLIYGPSERLIVTVGLDNIVVVDTPDALLVMRADRAQDVKQIVEQLRETGQTSYL